MSCIILVYFNDIYVIGNNKSFNTKFRSQAVRKRFCPFGRTAETCQIQFKASLPHAVIGSNVSLY